MKEKIGKKLRRRRRQTSENVIEGFFGARIVMDSGIWLAFQVCSVTDLLQL